MSSILSVYLSNHHDYKSTWDYLRALQPAWVNIHQPNARTIWQVQQHAPNARIMLRSWDIDDHNNDRKRELYADPKGAARKHLEMWKRKWEELEAELKRNGWQYNVNRWYLGLVNEPDPAYVPQVVEYSLEAMHLIEYRDIRLGVVASSVGTFSKPSENPHGWAKFKPLEQPINDGGHILLAHEYFEPKGPSYGEDAGNLAWRHQHIPLNVPILIREAGANGFIFNRYTNQDDGGWQRYMDAATYARLVKEYIEGCDQRVQGVCLYMTDYHSDQWRTFDTTPAHTQLLAIKDARPQRPNPFAKQTTHIPTIGTGSPTVPQPAATPGFVNAVSGVNLRAAPNTSSPILTAIPYAAQVQLTGVQQNGWLKARYGNHEGYVSAQYISEREPKPAQPTAPATEPDAWARTYAFTKRWEGGYQNVRNDAGNWTGGRVGEGELRGTKYGISAASYPHLDIKNLTPQDAERIYRTDYWQRSGANTLPWPACLLVFDTAVLHGVGTAQTWLREVGPNPYLFAAKRLRSYTKMGNWDFWGKAWTLRVAELLEEISR